MRKFLRHWLGLDDTDRKLALLIKATVAKPEVTTEPVKKGYDAGVRRAA